MSRGTRGRRATPPATQRAGRVRGILGLWCRRVSIGASSELPRSRPCPLADLLPVGRRALAENQAAAPPLIGRSIGSVRRSWSTAFDAVPRRDSLGVRTAGAAVDRINADRGRYSSTNSGGRAMDADGRAKPAATWSDLPSDTCSSLRKARRSGCPRPRTLRFISAGHRERSGPLPRGAVRNSERPDE